MKTERFCAPGSRPDILALRADCSLVRLIVWGTSSPDETLEALKRHVGIALPVRLAAAEGVLEYKEKSAGGRRTWPMDRWVEHALGLMRKEADALLR